MTSCPTNDPNNPFPSNTPYVFKGVVPNGPTGARVRLEYTNPNASGATDTVIVTLGPGGTFSDTHSFPSVGYTYGADVIPRYPNDPLSPGMGCDFAIM